MTRQRHVFPRAQVAHLFASQAQDSARDPYGNFYFNGPTLFSYGSHYPIARLLPEGFGGALQRTVLMNADSSTVTTERHKREARPALRHMRLVDVPDLDRHDDAMTAARKVIKAMRSEVKSAARERIHADTRRAAINCAKRYADDARHLLIGFLADAKNEKDARANARRMLRTIPADDAWPDIGYDTTFKDARTIAQAFAVPILRDEYRNDMTRELGAFRQSDERARGGEPSAYGGDARYRYDRAKLALDRYGAAQVAAKLAGARIPAKDRNAAESLRAALPAMLHAADMSDRSATKDRYGRAVAQLRHLIATDPESWRVREELNNAKRATLELSSTDTGEQATARENEIAALEQSHAETMKASAPTRYAQAVDLARGYLKDGELNRASDAVQSAQRIAARHELDDTNARDLAADIMRAQQAANAERIEAWRNGAGTYLSRDMTGGDHAGALLRVNTERAVIETSWGADVPLDVAPLVWRAVTRARSLGSAMEWTDNAPFKLGHYRLDKITAAGDVIAGCHVMRYAELARMAETLGYARRDS